MDNSSCGFLGKFCLFFCQISWLDELSIPHCIKILHKSSIQKILVNLILFRVLAELISRTQCGATALELCKIGDDMIVQETDKVYKKEKEMQKGIAFPTQANVNNCICHYAPLSSVQNGTVTLQFCKKNCGKITISRKNSG